MLHLMNPGWTIGCSEWILNIRTPMTSMAMVLRAPTAYSGVWKIRIVQVVQTSLPSHRALGTATRDQVMVVANLCALSVSFLYADIAISNYWPSVIEVTFL